MIQKATKFFCVILCIICAFSLFKMVYLTKEDRKNLCDAISFIEVVKNRKNEAPLFSHVALQKRKNMQKDFYFLQGKERVHYQIKAKNSTLLLTPESKQVDLFTPKNMNLFEMLDDIDCFLEEGGELTKELRHIKAAKGIFDYRSHLFKSDKAFIYSYRLPKFQPISNISLDDSYVRSVAEKLSISLFSKTPSFKAKSIQAKVY